LSANARVPSKGSAFAAGYDLYSAEDTILQSGERRVVNTDIAVALPTGTYGRVAPRSGLSLLKDEEGRVVGGLDIAAGVIDSDYRGPVGVIMVNNSSLPHKVGRGDRIAQLIVEQLGNVAAVQVVTGLKGSGRGLGGYGSTGR
jgi:dUTP pyrophosphatase